MSSGDLQPDVWKRDPLRARRPGGFRTVELNVVGWSALVGVGLLLGGLLLLLTAIPAAVALPAGVLFTWAVLLILDNHRWRNSKINIGRGDLDETTAQNIVERLRTMGITATYLELHCEGDVQRGITCRQADAEVVRRVLDEERL